MDHILNLNCGIASSQSLIFGMASPQGFTLHFIVHSILLPYFWPSQNELAPTNAPCKMEDMWTLMLLHCIPILCTTIYLPSNHLELSMILQLCLNLVVQISGIINNNINILNQQCEVTPNLALQPCQLQYHDDGNMNSKLTLIITCIHTFDS